MTRPPTGPPPTRPTLNPFSPPPHPLPARKPRPPPAWAFGHRPDNPQRPDDPPPRPKGGACCPGLGSPPAPSERGPLTAPPWASRAHRLQGQREQRERAKKAATDASGTDKKPLPPGCCQSRRPRDSATLQVGRRCRAATCSYFLTRSPPVLFIASPTF